MAVERLSQERVFKAAGFAKAAKKASIDDDERCAAIQQVMQGQADDLGGGVFKKRLRKNLYRSIILAKGGTYWVYEYLFAKNDQANIAVDDLVRLRKLAKAYGMLSETEVTELLREGAWVEICR